MRLPTLELPTYETTLPASKTKVKYRPFIVKEEKVLLLALEEGKSEQILNAMGQIIDACTFSKCDIKKMVQVDVEYLFIAIRNKSLGEGIELIVTCPKCDNTTEMLANLEEIKVIEPEEKVSNEIKLNDNSWLVMNYPSLINTYSVSDDVKSKSVEEVIAECISKLIINNETYDMKDYAYDARLEWVNNLTEKQRRLVVAFFNSVPHIVYEKKYTCSKCGHVSDIRLEGLDAFFG